jgi:predicted Rossmann-fold nucleotide-binding protein
MGCLADAVLEKGGRIIGVVPRLLADQGLAYEGLSDLRVVETMQERKGLMVELADATIALPGGVGTQDEFWEVLAGAQRRVIYAALLFAQGALGWRYPKALW